MAHADGELRSIGRLLSVGECPPVSPLCPTDDRGVLRDLLGVLTLAPGG